MGSGYQHAWGPFTAEVEGFESKFPMLCHHDRHKWSSITPGPFSVLIEALPLAPWSISICLLMDLKFHCYPYVHSNDYTLYCFPPVELQLNSVQHWMAIQ